MSGVVPSCSPLFVTGSLTLGLTSSAKLAASELQRAILSLLPQHWEPLLLSFLPVDQMQVLLMFMQQARVLNTLSALALSFYQDMRGFSFPVSSSRLQ